MRHEFEAVGQLPFQFTFVGFLVIVNFVTLVRFSSVPLQRGSLSQC